MQWQRGINHVITQKVRVVQYAVAKGNKSCHNQEIVQYAVSKVNKSCHNPENAHCAVCSLKGE